MARRKAVKTGPKVVYVKYDEDNYELNVYDNAKDAAAAENRINTACEELATMIGVGDGRIYEVTITARAATVVTTVSFEDA